MKRITTLLLDKLPVLIPFIVTATIIVFTFLTFFDFFEPYLYPLHMAQGKARVVRENCVVGPYPRDRELASLKSSLGTTHIISLLDIQNLPQEKALDTREKKLCDKYHLHLINYPLSYFSLDNAVNQEKIRSLLAYIDKHPKDKFYIHCYLGKHRAGKVEMLLRQQKRMIQQ